MKTFIVDLDNVILAGKGFPAKDHIRPYSIELLYLLLKFGEVHLFSTSTFMTNIFILRHSYHDFKYNTGGYSLIDYMIKNKINSYNSLYIHNDFCFDCLIAPKMESLTSINMLPIFYVKDDAENGILKDYLSYKLDANKTVKEMDFSDWKFRVGFIKTKCHFEGSCNSKRGH